ncbi:MAG: pentapeptide repeat-containing protein [Synechococcaceae cyanobacterium]|nr:pentapeptide repeat-containing protein [Synechococcaceae cyanobacterium]
MLRRPRFKVGITAFSWILILSCTGVLLWSFRPLPKLILAVFLLVLLLRVAHLIPGFGRGWRWLFGEREFWEWMVLLAGPVILAVIGHGISNTLNKAQEKVATIANRLDISNQYYNGMADLMDSGGELANPGGDAAAASADRPIPLSQDCSPAVGSPSLSMAYARTTSTLSSLTNLRLPEENYNPLKRGIVQMLYYAGYIRSDRPILSMHKADLRHANLSYIDLAKACFNGAFIRFSDLSGSRLDGSSFKEAIMADSLFVGSSLSGANLRRADLRGSSLKAADLSAADLSGARVEEAQLMNARLVGAKLHCASLEGSDLRGADLRTAELRGVVLANADLRGARLDGVILGEASCDQGRPPRETNLRNAIYNSRTVDNRHELWAHQRIRKVLEMFRHLVAHERLLPLSEEVRLEPTAFPSPFPTKDMRLENSARTIHHLQPLRDEGE